MSDTPFGPVRISEDATTGDRFLVYATEKGLRLDISYEGDALWMTQAQIAQLFGRDVSTISRHIANIIEEGELDESASLQNAQRSLGRSAVLYSLDMVISVGYRVSSAQATLFRRWATNLLVQFATKGFVVDKVRLKSPESSDRLVELREIIRDLRSDEANLYRELRKICSMCQDYDGSTEAAREFYQRIQAKLVYAVTSMTPSEIINDRANHQSENMGLENWPGDNIRKQDVTVSKNYLGQKEITELNRLTTILLDIFEDQLDIGKIIIMKDAMNLLERQLKSLGRPILSSGGSVSNEDAKRAAEAQYALYDSERKRKRREAADAAISKISLEAKTLARK